MVDGMNGMICTRSVSDRSRFLRDSNSVGVEYLFVVVYSMDDGRNS